MLILYQLTAALGYIELSLKMKTKGVRQYVMPAIFYLEIGEVKIRTTNSQFCCQSEKCKLIAVIYT